MSQFPPASSEPPPNLAEPKDTPFTSAQLAEYDGTDLNRPIYVAVKGTIFDVTGKRPLYGVGGSYHVFAGKDASKLKTLDDWYNYYKLRYNIVGKVTS
ncbi:19948_t:CDS:2 [Gigaspora rosea]|nr:19948_t:CDS:2 [Gigaspora rosea]